jgi:hypothetical protein
VSSDACLVRGEFCANVYSAFAAIKDLDGDWKKDPRYEDSWYFVCAKPEGK